MWGAWEQRQENCVIRILDQMTVWMGGPAVIGVEDEEQRREDAALRGASRSKGEVREGVVDQHCHLLVRKFVIHSISWSSRWKRVESFFARMCGCRVLNAEESPAVVLGCSRCLYIVSMMYILASSTPLPVQFANWRGSISGSVTLMMWFLMTLSIAFITSEVRATGLRSFRALTEFFLGTETTVECFHSWGRCRCPYISEIVAETCRPAALHSTAGHGRWCCLGQVLCSPWSSWGLSLTSSVCLCVVFWCWWWINDWQIAS